MQYYTSLPRYLVASLPHYSLPRTCFFPLLGVKLDYTRKYSTSLHVMQRRIPVTVCKPEELVATFSIVAYDPRNGDLGVAVQSKFLAVGAVVPWAKALVPAKDRGRSGGSRHPVLG